jgi:diguanylate cyclase (GGDEF)-like protein
VSTDADPRQLNNDSSRRLKITVGAVIVVGAVFLVAAAARAFTNPMPPNVGWYDVAIAVVTVTTCARAMLIIRIGVKQYGQSLTDIAILLGLMLLPGSWMVIAVAMGVTVAKILARVPANRIAFNAAKDVITVGLAAAVGAMFGLPMPYQVGAKSLPALAVVGAVIVTIDELLAIPVLALASGERIRDVFASGAIVRIGTAVLRIVLALCIGFLLGFDNRLAVVTPVIAVGWHFYFANRTQQRTERFSWQRLAQTADEIGSAEEAAVHDAAVRGAADMFNCDEVEIEVRLAGVEPRLIRGDSAGVTYDGPPIAPTPGRSTVQVATLDTQDGSTAGRAGELRLYFRKRVTFGEREHFTLRAYAATIGTALRKTAAVAEAARMTTRHALASHHDALTGLANRTFLVEYASTTSSRLGLAIIDLNQFKQFNDVLGQAGGDRALREVACRLASGAQANDLVTRLGGDSFAVLFVDVSSPADAIARTRAVVATLIEPMTLDNIRFEVGATAGVAVGPPLGATGVTAAESRTAYGVEELLRRADVAVNEAKRDGLPIGVFTRNRDTADAGRLSLMAELRQAVTDQQFVVVFQPIVDLATGEVRSAEGLARWQHPQHGNLPPHRFLASIERSGLLSAFTAQVLDRSLAGVRRWRDEGFDMPVAVNVSPRSLLDPEFPASIPRALAAHHLPPEALTIELTETLTLSQLEVVDDVLHALRGIGVKLALDDFGTGFSSLATIARVPVNELKIDRAFVSSMSGTAEGAIVRSTIELGRSLNLLVVAEGVETEEQRDRLWRLGCPAGQGHLFGRPMALDTFMAALCRGHDGVRGRLVAPVQATSSEGSVIPLSSVRRAV